MFGAERKVIKFSILCLSFLLSLMHLLHYNSLTVKKKLHNEKEEEGLQKILNDTNGTEMQQITEMDIYTKLGIPMEVLQDLPYISQIDNDMKPFSSGITLDMVKRAHEIGCAIRLQYINMTLYSYLILEIDRAPYGYDMCNGRANSFTTLIKRVVDRFPLLPDFDIVVNSLDNCRICNMDGNTMAYNYFGDSGMFWPPVWENIPIFSFQKLDGCIDILIPAAIVGLGSVDYDNDVQHISDVSKNYHWSNKQDRLIWRGSGTGGLWTNTNLDSKARYRIFIECERDELKDICDVGMSGLFQTLPGEVISNEKLPIKGNIAFDDWMSYKYELVLDGNGSPAGRIDRQLKHNSLVLMQETAAHQMYTKYLRPYVHYVPLNNNVSDLSDAYHWAKENEDTVLQIVENANKFAEYLKMEPVLAYTGVLLFKYSELQSFVPQLESGYIVVG